MSVEIIFQFIENQNYMDFKQIQLLECIGTIHMDCIITILSLIYYSGMTQMIKMVCFLKKIEIHYNPTVPWKMDYLRIDVVNACLLKNPLIAIQMCCTFRR